MSFRFRSTIGLPCFAFSMAVCLVNNSSMCLLLYCIA
jgi:hypothetical protein